MRNDLVLAPLREQIQDTKEETLDRTIEGFSCSKDPDVELFLKDKAVLFERSGISRTYLYMINDETNPEIVAFFSVSPTSSTCRAQPLH